MRSFSLQVFGGLVCASALVGCKHSEPTPTATPLPTINVTENPKDKSGTLTIVPPPPAPIMVPSLPNTEMKPRDLVMSGLIRPTLEPKPDIVVPLQPAITELPATNLTPAKETEVPPPKHKKFDHSLDYRMLVGEVSYSAVKKEWRLRYADLGDVDIYGGSVTLTGSVEFFEQLKEGQMVRVEGMLMDRNAEIAPLYRVSALKVQD